jgi:hypothetical protein
MEKWHLALTGLPKATQPLWEAFIQPDYEDHQWPGDLAEAIGKLMKFVQTEYQRTYGPTWFGGYTTDYELKTIIINWFYETGTDYRPMEATDDEHYAVNIDAIVEAFKYCV